MAQKSSAAKLHTGDCHELMSFRPSSEQSADEFLKMLVEDPKYDFVFGLGELKGPLMVVSSNSPEEENQGNCDFDEGNDADEQYYLMDEYRLIHNLIEETEDSEPDVEQRGISAAIVHADRIDHLETIDEGNGENNSEYGYENENENENGNENENENNYEIDCENNYIEAEHEFKEEEGEGAPLLVNREYGGIFKGIEENSFENDYFDDDDDDDGEGNDFIIDYKSNCNHAEDDDDVYYNENKDELFGNSGNDEVGAVVLMAAGPGLKLAKRNDNRNDRDVNDNDHDHNHNNEKEKSEVDKEIHEEEEEESQKENDEEESVDRSIEQKETEIDDDYDDEVYDRMFSYSEFRSHGGMNEIYFGAHTPGEEYDFEKDVLAENNYSRPQYLNRSQNNLSNSDSSNNINNNDMRYTSDSTNNSDNNQISQQQQQQLESHQGWNSRSERLQYLRTLHRRPLYPGQDQDQDDDNEDDYQNADDEVDSINGIEGDDANEYNFMDSYNENDLEFEYFNYGFDGSHPYETGINFPYRNGITIEEMASYMTLS